MESGQILPQLPPDIWYLARFDIEPFQRFTVDALIEGLGDRQEGARVIVNQDGGRADAGNASQRYGNRLVVERAIVGGMLARNPQDALLIQQIDGVEDAGIR